MCTFAKTIKLVFLIPLAVVGLFLLLFLISPPINDMSAADIEKQLAALPLPEYTELREGFSAAGKLSGNGNGMQFFGAILIETELSQEELYTHYGPYRKSDYDCIVEPQTNAELTMIEHGYSRHFQNWREPEPPKQAYIVYTWGSGNAFFSAFDLRGH